MEKTTNFFAVDLGATSGRTILGSIEDGKLKQREITRFPNTIIELGGHFYWDLYALYNEIVKGLKVCADEGIELTSIGIDTWGCDFAVFGADGGLLRNPYCYRDPHTEGAMEEYFKLIPKEKVYEKTGIQFMNFNSLFQLATMRRNNDSALSIANKILFIPDALMYMLTGEAVCEYTVLSTSQMLNPRTKTIDTDLIDVIGLKESQFGRYVNPSDQVGTLTPEVQRLTGLGAVPVVAVAGHDTGAAVAAVPAQNPNFAYLSCGTWSLLGIETQEAIINEKSFEYNFTNEGGIEGTTRFLKNICGMWLLERCRKEWTDAPANVNQINEDAMTAEPFRSFINPDDPRFANPTSMVDAIQGFCKETNQPVPETYQQIARCIFESLALRYRQVLDYLRELAPFPIEKLHVIGGGTYNQYLMQMAANSIGIPVVTGPVEGTAIGNIMLQAKASGLVSDMFQMRKIIAESIKLNTYLPQESKAWDEAYQRFINL
ncbi:MAG: rhamnulokinase [Bacteroidaceae bacterium]|jgi:rhamnulokinase|nr:rhamnulokinase [Bacteroidaceae bacterium]MBR6047798.1 rhamnulokinase [Bacteroidaceae bacterium]